MRTSTDKKATTVRLSVEIKTQLQNVARLRRDSESALIELSLTEWFKNHGYTTRYVMTANALCYALTRYDGATSRVIDQQIRDQDIPLEEIRQIYSARFNSPVDLEIDEGAKS